MTETHPDPVLSPRRGLWRRVVGWAVAGVVGLLLALAGAGGAFLETQAGRDWLKATVEAALADPQGVRLTVGSVEGSVFSSLTVHDLRLADPQGVWLAAEQVRLSWSPSALGRGLLRVEALTARDLTFERLPILPPDPTPSDDEGFFKLRWLTRVRVGALDVRDLTLGEALVGQRTQLRITGDSRPGPDERLHVRLDLARTDAIPGSLSLEAALGPSPAPLRLHLAAAEPAGGVVARLLNLPGLPPLDLRVDGEGPLTGWEGFIKADAGALVQASGRMTAAVDSEGTGRLSLGLGVLPGPAAPALWQAAVGERLEVVLGAERDSQGRVTLTPSAVTGAGWQAHLEGWLEDDRFAAKLGLEATSPPLVAALLPGASLAALHLRAEAEGRLSQPKGEVTLSTGAIRVTEGVGAEAWALRVTATPADAHRLVLALEATPTGLVLPGQGRMLGAAPVLQARGLWDPQTHVLTLTQAVLTGDATTLEANLTVFPQTGRLAEGRLVLDLPDLARLDGGLTGQARLTVEPRDLSGRAGTVEVRLEGYHLGGGAGAGAGSGPDGTSAP
ncbi:hypothetical protein [Pararhodospirillum photometricum]|uniref:DUF3971 domain-containing protein n=1 Tax=Pararhodospirillum photometricum DSM 122 TaxID=1150469 RepID=H6SSE6_PARPM|nr:hypothetical protein [Pararhodospirillum photometricum]CCG07825.1 Putative uncharacterized protein [Pararhodospirillum photometricum DSM 122]